MIKAEKELREEDGDFSSLLSDYKVISFYFLCLEYTYKDFLIFKFCSKISFKVLLLYTICYY